MKEKIFDDMNAGPFKAKVDERYHKLGQDCPNDGWVTGYLLRDLHQGEVLPHIFNCPCTWVVKEETIELVGFHIAQWIKVEDRLPENCDDVFFSWVDESNVREYGVGYYTNLYINNEGFYLRRSIKGIIPLKFVDYWMPIVPPKED